MSDIRQTKNGLFQSLTKLTIAVTSTALLGIALSGKAAMANNNNSFTDYANVIHVEPAFRYVTVQVPQRICTPHHGNHSGHRNNNYHDRHHNRGQHATSHRRDSAGAVFIGGLIGGAIGREVSKSVNGRSNVAATITGAVIGSTLANAAHQSGNSQVRHYGANTKRHNGHHSSHHRPNRRHNPNRHHNNQRCTTTTQSRQERRPNGYDVTYVYHGRTFHTRTRHHPGHKIAVNVAVSKH